jgi:hypothetical protein
MAVLRWNSQFLIQTRMRVVDVEFGQEMVDLQCSRARS